MGEGGETSEDLAMRRRRLRFRCWHRGMKEVDLLLGRFADAHVDALDADGVTAFEALLERPDQDILGWIVGGEPVPDVARSPLIDRLLAFYAA
jgi:antitoxin CptB